jgi:hypothetical protein
MVLTKAEYNRHAGLGNKLFAWSRAKVLSSEYDIKMISTKWVSIRGASVIRGGIDYNNVFGKIFLFNNFINDRSEVSEYFYKTKCSKNFNMIYVSNIDEAREYVDMENVLIVFKWDGDHFFTDLESYRDFVKNKLVNITKPKTINNTIYGHPFIGLNIRMGNDFIDASSSADGFRKTHMDWYLDNVANIRQRHGNLPVCVVSDGSSNLLKSIFSKIDNVTIVRNKTAIEDLLFLSNARALMGAGNSSFSAWASFLGNMPTYSSPDTPFEQFRLQNVKMI